MSKFLKYSIGTIVAIIVLLIISGLVIKSYIDPAMLEARIVSEVHDRTGRDLIIKDGLNVSFFPSLHFEIQQATLGNPPNFGDNTHFADIGTLEFTIELLPLLLEKHIVLNEVILNNSTFNLITLANGQTNWKDFSNTSSTKPAKVVKTSAPDTNASKAAIGFDIGELVISQSTLNWKDHQKNKQWQVTDLNVDGSNIAFNQAFPLKMSGKYNQANNAATTWEIDSKINIDTTKQIYILKPFTLKANVEGTKPVNISLSELEFSEPDQIIALKDGVFSGSNINGKGNLNITSFKKNPKAKGQFTFDALELGNFKTTNVSVPISSQNDVYIAQPITSKLYGGTFTGDLTLNNSGNVPQWQLKYQLANINLQSLLADMGSSNKFSGIMQSNGQLSAVGLSGDSIKASLSGPAHFKIDNGVYSGIDLTYWWQVGKALMEAAATAAIPTVNVVTDIANVVNLAQFKNTNQTAFTDITGDFTFKNGVGTTNNLILYNDVIYVKAEGQIDINKKYVDLKLYISQSTGILAKGTPIPFTLKGNFGQLQVKPDVAAFPSSIGSAAAAVTNGAASLSNKAPEALKQPIQQIGNALGGLLNKK